MITRVPDHLWGSLEMDLMDGEEDLEQAKAKIVEVPSLESSTGDTDLIVKLLVRRKLNYRAR